LLILSIRLNKTIITIIFAIKISENNHDYNAGPNGLVVSELDSRLESRGFKSHPLLDGNGVKAMPGSIPAINPGSLI